MTGTPGATSTVDELLQPIRHKRVRRLPWLVRSALRIVWRAAPAELAASCALQLLAGVALAGQLLTGRALLELLGGTADGARRVWPLLVAFGLLTAIVGFATYARIEQQRLLSELVGRQTTDDVIAVAAGVDLVDFDDPRFHDRLLRARLNAVVRPLQMVTGVLGAVSSGFAIVGVAGALVILNPLYVLLIVLAYAPAWLITTRASRAVFDFTTQETERDRRRTYLFSVLTEKASAAEVRAFQLGGFLRDRHRELFTQRVDGLRVVVRRRLLLGLAGAVITSALSVATVGVLVWSVLAGRATLATAGAAAGAVLVLGQRLQALAGGASSIYEAALYMEDFVGFVEGFSAEAQCRPGHAPPEDPAPIQAADVTFTYPSRTAPALRGVTLSVAPGQVVALLGENGSGKTTVAKLLAGLYLPETGTVTWDGVDTAALDSARSPDRVAIVFQDFVRYHLSVADNIVMGRHTRADEPDAVEAAARRAGAHDVVTRLGDGYATRLGPEYLGGSDLSGGEWQRVALARAYFRDAPFLILDEPTAALDPRAEAALFASVRDLFAGRSVLLISHRFASARTADHIYVLRDGCVAEHGTHDELMREGGLYAELFTLQAAAYADTGS